MPKATMVEEDQWKLPADEPLPAVLNAVKEDVINYKDKKTGEDKSFTKWVWEFEITEGPYAGLRAWGDTQDRLTSHPDNKVRQWGETLRGAAFDIGEGIDTDDLLGLPCHITVSHEETTKKDGTPFYKCPVQDVFPADLDVDPPF